MTELKSIWHKLPEQPEKRRDVLEKWQDRGIIHYTHFISKNGIAEDNPFTISWCYLDDLIACEQELADTKNKLEYAGMILKNLLPHLNGYEKLDVQKAIKRINNLPS